MKQVYMILRPHVKEFLQAMAKTYEVCGIWVSFKIFTSYTNPRFLLTVYCVFQLFVYTCAKREYAEKILEILDPQRKLFRYVSQRK